MSDTKRWKVDGSLEAVVYPIIKNGSVKFLGEASIRGVVLCKALGASFDEARDVLRTRVLEMERFLAAMGEQLQGTQDS